MKQLVQVQGQMNGAAGKNAVVVAGGVAVAAVVAAVPALASLAPDALALALSNPAAAVNAGIITAETAAAIVTNSVTPSVAVEGAAAKAGATANAANDAIQFGRVENQVSHTFRHIEAAGFDRDVVQSAIQTDLSRLADSIPQGQYIGSVTVNGVKLDYSAFKLPDGTINVGRITPPRTN
ncbi:hypothetical protein [Caballeronia sp. ATUFL_M2_KS44]|uniref:hypothetical protein n=1 Tax=Caballeronia sp. ATUFL_M2_KS44 TaxID=2921767 RepID=UPI0020289559|nr:hypothetical protein [Caballeronia sp. ATUFL_M2_KS44]